MSLRSFSSSPHLDKVCSFLGGLVGGFAGILSFGSLEGWLAMGGLLSTTIVGFLVGYFVPRCIAHLDESKRRLPEVQPGLSKRLVTYRETFVRERVYIWALLVAASFLVTALIGVYTNPETWLDTTPSDVTKAFLFVSFMSLFCTCMILNMIRDLLRNVFQWHSSDEVYAGFLYPFVLLGQFVCGLRDNDRIRVWTSLIAAHVLFVVLSGAVAYVVFDSIPAGFFCLMLWCMATLAFVHDDENPHDPLNMAGREKVRAWTDAVKKQRFEYRATLLRRHGLFLSTLIFLSKLFYLGVLALPLSAWQLVTTLAASFWWGLCAFPLMLLQISLNLALESDKNRYRVGLVVTLGITCVTGLVSQSILEGHALLGVALLNGFACGGLSVLGLMAMDVATKRIAWIRTLRVSGVRRISNDVSEWYVQNLTNRIHPILSKPFDAARVFPGYWGV